MRKSRAQKLNDPKLNSNNYWTSKKQETVCMNWEIQEIFRTLNTMRIHFAEFEKQSSKLTPPNAMELQTENNLTRSNTSLSRIGVRVKNLSTEPRDLVESGTNLTAELAHEQLHLREEGRNAIHKQSDTRSLKQFSTSTFWPIPRACSGDTGVKSKWYPVEA